MPFHLRRELLRRRSIEAVAIVFDCHLRNDRRCRDAPHRADRGANLVQVAERLEDEQIDTAGDKRLGLLAKERLRLIGPHLAPGLDANTQRSNRTGDIGLITGRLTGKAGAFGVDLVDPVAKAERPELHAIGAKRVRLDHVGTRTDVILMHLHDGVRRHHIQRIEAAIDEHALRVEHRAHGAVADEHALVEGF